MRCRELAVEKTAAELLGPDLVGPVAAECPCNVEYGYYQCWEVMEYMYRRYIFKIQNMSNRIQLQLPFKKVVLRIQ